MMNKTTTLALLALAVTGLASAQAGVQKLVPLFELSGKNATFYNKKGNLHATSTVRGKRTVFKDRHGNRIAVAVPSACGTFTEFRCAKNNLLAVARTRPNGTTEYRNSNGSLIVKAKPHNGLRRLTTYQRQNGTTLGTSFQLGRMVGFRKANGQLHLRAQIELGTQHNAAHEQAPRPSWGQHASQHANTCGVQNPRVGQREERRAERVGNLIGRLLALIGRQ